MTWGLWGMDGHRLASTPEVSGDTLGRVIDSYRTTPEAQRRYKADDAAGWCEESMEDFIRHAKQHGVEASRHEFNYPLRSAFPTPHRSLGWQPDDDEEQDRWDGFHYAPVVNVGGNPHVVDWTMNQLKPDAQFPHVEPLNSYGSRFAYHVPYEPPYPYYDDDHHTASRTAGMGSPSHTIRYQPSTDPAGGGSVTMHHGDNEDYFGFLGWQPGGKIGWVSVEPEYRRTGVAQALLEHARMIDPTIHAGDPISEEGEAWQQVMFPPHTASRTAMPAIDAYDKDFPIDERREHPRNQQSGPWFHGSDHDLPNGTILVPGKATKWQQIYDNPNTSSRANWVWFTPGINHAATYGQHVYEVEPLDEGPWPWNDHRGQHVSPRARIIRKVDPYKEAKLMTAAVTVYTKPNCPQCNATHKHLTNLGIDHDTVDVTQDPEAHAYVTGLGYASAPVVVVNDGEDHWSGFRPDRLKGLAE